MVITRQLTDSASASTASDIQLGSCVTEIGQGAFSGYTNITEVELPESITAIGVGAFSGCSNIISITVNPVTPPTLGEDAFDGSTCAIVVPSESYNSYIQSSWSAYKNRITYEGMSLKLKFVSNSASSILACDGNSITKDAVDGIYFSDITATTIGSCATEIGQGAFSGKTLGNVTFEEGATTIRDKAFYDINTNLAYSTITLPKSLTTIGSQVFNRNNADTRLEITAYGDSGLKLNKSSFTSGDNQRGTFKLNLYNMPILENAFNTYSFDFGLREVGVFGMSSIGNSAFKNCSGLASVTIGDGVRVIEDSAFQDNVVLTNLTFGNSLLDIGSNAFYNCSSLSSITIPNSVTSIGGHAFRDCSGLTSITLGNNVATIGEYAFFNSKGVVNMSDSVINVGDYAFTEGYLNKLSSNIANIGSNAFYKCKFENFVLPRTIRTIGKGAFRSCSGLTNVTIPSSIASVGVSAFTSSDIKSVTFENGFSTIPEACLRFCSSLTSVTIPDSVTSISNHAFGYCSSLASVTIPSGVTSIGEYAFQACTSLTSVIVNAATPPTLDSRAFNDTPLKNGAGVILVQCEYVDVYKAASGWSDYAAHIIGLDPCPSTFSGKIKIKDTNNNIIILEDCSSTDIKNNKYRDNLSIKEVEIGSCTTRIGQRAFGGCTNLSSVNFILPSSVSGFSGLTFSNCSSLSSITIPDSITNIGFYEFEYCTSLSSITIPNSVTSIGSYAFQGCTSLASVTIPDSVTSISSYAFWGCSSLASLTIGDGVTSIDSSVFRGCTSLASVSIGRSLTEISSLFSGCTNLSSVDFMLPSSVSSIGSNAFYKCSSLTSITIPSSVTSIGAYAFRYCSGLTSVSLPSSVTSIGGYSFANCSGLTSVTIPDSVTSIGNYAFSNCSSLIAASLSNGLTSIASSLFRECLRLLSITIPSGVTSIGEYAFYGCRSLTSITVNATTPPTLSSDVFGNTNDCIIYVPSASVDVYKEAVTEGWSNYASRIQPIPNS